MAAFGFEVEVTKKVKTADSGIESAFIKAGTLINILNALFAWLYLYKAGAV